MQTTTNISSTFSEYPTGGYRFRFNGQEKDEKIYNNQSTTTALFWEYEGRIGRRWNRDPVVKSWMSSYHSFSNKPLINIDPNGNNDEVYINGSKNATTQPEIWDDTIAKFNRIRLPLIESPLFLKI